MPQPEYITNPVDVIQKLFSQAQHDRDNFFDDWGVYDFFEKALNSPEEFNKIPLLTSENAHLLPDHSLVRYQGMVQDLLNPEYFAGAIRVKGKWMTTKFHDPDLSRLEDVQLHGFAGAPGDDDDMSMCDDAAAQDYGMPPTVSERRAAYCIPVPGMSKWAEPPQAPSIVKLLELHATTAASDAPAAGNKRSRDDPMESDEEESKNKVATKGGSQSTTVEERTLTVPVSVSVSEAEGEEKGEAQQDRRKRGAAMEKNEKADEGADGKAQNAKESEKTETGKEKEKEQELPLQEVPGSCLVYLYDMHAHHHVYTDVVTARREKRKNQEPPKPPQEEREEQMEQEEPSASHLFPFVKAGGPSCLGGPPSLHEVIDVVGVLSHIPALAQLSSLSSAQAARQSDILDPDLDLDLGEDGSSGQETTARTTATDNNNSNNNNNNDDDDQRKKKSKKQSTVSGNDHGGGVSSLCAMAAGPAMPMFDEADDFLMNDYFDNEAIVGQHPPTSSVLRLHAILVRRHRDGCWVRAVGGASTTSEEPPAVFATIAAVSESATNTTNTTTTAVVETTDDDLKMSDVGHGGEDAPEPFAPFASLPVSWLKGVGRGGVPREAEVAALRQAAIGFLQRAVGGDALAAEYILLQTLGRVTHRAEDRGMGQIALNITRCPPSVSPSIAATAAPALATAPASLSTNGWTAGSLVRDHASQFARTLSSALSALVPICAALPLNVAAVNNDRRWMPSRSLRLERTHASPLQLPFGSLLLLDETAMATGQLSEKGMESLYAVKGLVDAQVLKYDFSYGNKIQNPGFGEMPVPVDVTPIVLSVGRSLLRDEVHVTLPLSTTAPVPLPEALQALVAREEAALAAIRAYLAAARQLPYGIGAETGSVLEQYFVRQRQESAAARTEFTPEQFAAMLSLARLYTLSFGETSLSKSRWESLLALEHKRQERSRAPRG